MFSFKFFLKKKISQKIQGGRGLDRTSVFRGGDFFHGGCNFSTKNKLKSGIFNDKKSL